jgi:thiol-disulfide isomerase/thioredoxin
MKAILLAFLLLGGCATTSRVHSSDYDKQTVFSVQNLNCQGCGQEIADALKAVDGVANVSFDKEAVEVTIGYRGAKVNADKLMEVIRAQGFGVVRGAGKGNYAPHVHFDEGLDVKWLTKTGEYVKIEDHRVSGKVTVIDFGADWCGPCREVDDMMLRLLRKEKDVAFRKIDIVDWDTPVAKAYLSKAPELPYVVVFGKDGREVTRFPGLHLERLRKAIEKGRQAP